MASSMKSNMTSYTAAADLSAKQFYAVKLSANFSVNIAGAAEGHGLLQNKPVSGDQAEVAVNGGGGKAKLGTGGCTYGQSLKADSDGRLIVASTGDRAIAVAEQTGVENDVIAVIVGLHQA